MKRFSTLVLAMMMTIVLSLGTVISFAEESEDESAEKTVTVTVAKVTNVQAKALSESAIKVTWSKVSDADGYKVYRYNKNKKKYILMKTIKSGKTTKYVNKSLKSNTKKTYRVQAYVVNDGKVIRGKKSAKASATTKKSSVDKIMQTAKSKLGCSYSSGSCGPNRFDCSGYVYYVYNKTKAGKVSFSRTSAQGEYNQIKKYKVGSSIKSAKKGDIVFFSSTGKTSGINHVGIYAGNSKVIHAGSYRTGVCYCKTSALSKCGRKVCAVVRLAK